MGARPITPLRLVLNSRRFFVLFFRAELNFKFQIFETELKSLAFWQEERGEYFTPHGIEPPLLGASRMSEHLFLDLFEWTCF